jgi:gluconolactonase
VTAIPGVIAAGQKWTKVWEVDGNNADGPIADKNGDLWIAQNHNSKVVRLDAAGKVSTVYSDTHTGGALSMSKKGDVFMVQRGLHQNVSQMAPTRRVLAATLPNGDPIDCLGGVINDLTADSRGGVYFTMGGLFHVDAKGTITRYGENLTTNGIILSPDEKTLYVSNGGSVAAFDVQPDGSLKNQRQFVQLPVPGGDGMTVDAEGRLYVTAGPNVHVVSPEGSSSAAFPPRTVSSRSRSPGRTRRRCTGLRACRTRTGCSTPSCSRSRCRRAGTKGERSSLRPKKGHRLQATGHRRRKNAVARCQSPVPFLPLAPEIQRHRGPAVTRVQRRAHERRGRPGDVLQHGCLGQNRQAGW